jgi:outer membrane protein assembly factor BamB
MYGCSLSIALVCSSAVYGWIAPAGHQTKQEHQRIDVNGFYFPESVTVGPDGKYYVSNYGQDGVPGDGSIAVISGNPLAGDVTVSTLTDGMNSPTGAAFVGTDLYVADAIMVWKVPTTGETAGQKSVYLPPERFTIRPRGLNDLTADAEGNLYISDSSRRYIYKANPQGMVTLLLRTTTAIPWRNPNGVLVDTKGILTAPKNLLIVDFGTGLLSSLSPDGSLLQQIAQGFGAGDGLAFDSQDRLYISDYLGGKIFRVNPDKTSELFADDFTTPADHAIDEKTGCLIVPNFDISTVTFMKLP